MKISNRREIVLAMYGFLLLIIADILFLIFANNIPILDNETTYAIFLAILIFSVWRITLLKTFSLEISEHILSVKYRHPLAKKNNPVLEVPLHKVMHYQMEKVMLNNFITININTRKGLKHFYYKIGSLPKSEVSKLEKISDFISDMKKTKS